MAELAYDDIRDYYGRILETKADLKTSACCTIEAPSPQMRDLLANVHETVQAKFYGCGSPLPTAVEGRTVLDLGCGTGRDVYLMSQLVGSQGRAIGIDMTDEQLAVARQHIGWHMDRFGHADPNVEFIKGYIEDLASAGIEDNSIDVITSNCVINLSPDKEAVFREIFRVLKPGGELYFADVFAGRRVPESLRHDKVMRGECLGGALYTEDFRRILGDIGFPDYRVVTQRPLAVEDPALAHKAGMIDFHSMTVRAFKVDQEDICENYGHVARYRGTIAGCPHQFVLDDHHAFETGLPVPVCGNTANMLAQTRYRDHFLVEGDFSTHYGPFNCGPAASSGSSGETGGACC